MQVATAETPKNGKHALSPPPAIVENLALTLLDESPTNPRRAFANIEELAKDIEDHGVLEPILVRPKGKRFEIVFGARRFRGSKLAQRDTIPSMIRELSDEKAFELQVAENAQRSDLHPLEEADSYKTLHEKHKKSIEEIAALVAKSPATVRARLKYCTLGEEARQAFFDDRLTAATALIVASVPPQQQKAFLKDLFATCRDDVQPSRADAVHLLDRKFRVRLAEAPFDRADVTLVAAAGSCGTCPKRTGAQADLFGATKDDVCLDPSCFQAKCDAAWTKRIGAKAANERIMADSEAKKVFRFGRVEHDANYVDLDEKNYAVSPNGKSYGDLLGKKRSDVEIVLARDEDGKVRELVSKKAFAAAVPKAGIRVPSASKSKGSASAGGNTSAKDWEKKDRERRKKAEEAARQVLADIDTIVTASSKASVNDGFWRVVLRALVRSITPSVENEKAFVKALGLKPPAGGAFYQPKIQTQMLAAAARLKGDRARSLIVMRLLADDITEAQSETMADFRELYGIKVQAPAAEKKVEPAKTPTKKKVAKKKAKAKR